MVAMDKNTRSEIEIRLEIAWRDVRELRKIIDEKTKRLDGLHELGLTPYFASDLPHSEWRAIASSYAVIATLEELLRKERRKDLSKKRR